MIKAALLACSAIAHLLLAGTALAQSFEGEEFEGEERDTARSRLHLAFALAGGRETARETGAILRRRAPGSPR